MLISLSGCYSSSRVLGSVYDDMDKQVNHIQCEGQELLSVHVRRSVMSVFLIIINK